MQRPHRTAMSALAVGVLLAAGLTGCGGSAGGDNPVVAAPSDSSSACPAPGSGGAHWPAGVPADLPAFPGLVITSTQAADNGGHVVKGRAPLSLHDGVRFVLKQLPAAGYTLGQGDSESDEADAPFTKGTVQGSFRLSATQPCSTTVTLTINR